MAYYTYEEQHEDAPPATPQARLSPANYMILLLLIILLIIMIIILIVIIVISCYRYYQVHYIVQFMHTNVFICVVYSNAMLMFDTLHSISYICQPTSTTTMSNRCV